MPDSHLYHTNTRDRVRRFIATLEPIAGPEEREIIDQLDDDDEECDEYEVARRFIHQHEYLRRA